MLTLSQTNSTNMSLIAILLAIFASLAMAQDSFTNVDKIDNQQVVGNAARVVYGKAMFPHQMMHFGKRNFIYDLQPSSPVMYTPSQHLNLLRYPYLFAPSQQQQQQQQPQQEPLFRGRNLGYQYEVDDDDSNDIKQRFNSRLFGLDSSLAGKRLLKLISEGPTPDDSVSASSPSDDEEAISIAKAAEDLKKQPINISTRSMSGRPLISKDYLASYLYGRNAIKGPQYNKKADAPHQKENVFMHFG